MYMFVWRRKYSTDRIIVCKISLRYPNYPTVSSSSPAIHVHYSHERTAGTFTARLSWDAVFVPPKTAPADTHPPSPPPSLHQRTKPHFPHLRKATTSYHYVSDYVKTAMGLGESPGLLGDKALQQNTYLRRLVMYPELIYLTVEEVKIIFFASIFLLWLTCWFVLHN